MSRAASPDDDMARTPAEAAAQRLIIPEFEDWFEFAHTLDGYGLFDNLERSGTIGDLRWAHREHYRATGEWEGSLLDLRIVLFYEARARRFSDAPGYNLDADPEYRTMIMSLLGAIRVRARAAGQLADDHQGA